MRHVPGAEVFFWAPSLFKLVASHLRVLSTLHREAGVSVQLRTPTPAAWAWGPAEECWGGGGSNFVSGFGSIFNFPVSFSVLNVHKSGGYNRPFIPVKWGAGGGGGWGGILCPNRKAVVAQICEFEALIGAHQPAAAGDKA